MRRMNLSDADLRALDQYAADRGGRVLGLMDYDVTTLRRFWDNVGDNSFYEGPEGSFDCADIWSALTQKGDVEYCAV